MGFPGRCRVCGRGVGMGRTARWLDPGLAHDRCWKRSIRLTDIRARASARRRAAFEPRAAQIGDDIRRWNEQRRLGRLGHDK